MYEQLGFSIMCDLFGFVMVTFWIMHFICYKYFDMYSVYSEDQAEIQMKIENIEWLRFVEN